MFDTVEKVMSEIVVLNICNLTQTMPGCLYDHPESPPSIISVYIFFEIYFIITVTVDGVTQSHSGHSNSLLKLRQLTLGVTSFVARESLSPVTLSKF